MCNVRMTLSAQEQSVFLPIYILENAAHCGASLSERLKSVVGFLQLLKTVLFL